MTSMSRPRKSTPARRAPGPPKGKAPKPLAEELARDAVAHEKTTPGDRVEMTFKVRLRRPVAEALTAWAVREETYLAALVAEILESAVANRKA